jgi:hypothetical protein
MTVSFAAIQNAGWDGHHFSTCTERGEVQCDYCPGKSYATIFTRDKQRRILERRVLKSSVDFLDLFGLIHSICPHPYTGDGPKLGGAPG